MAHVIGIDLGTTTSLVAAIQGSDPQVIPLAEGGNLCPSIVAFSARGETLVGQAARRQALVNPQNTICSIKRLIGRRFVDVNQDRAMVSCRIVPGPGGAACIQVPALDRICTPQEISARLLQKLKHDAEAYLGGPVRQAVISVPAYFNERQRRATQEAGRLAGLEVLRIINEPTAAALAYGLYRQAAEKVLVWDLGGGTFDVSVLEAGADVIEVKASSGDWDLGGTDWDERIVRWILAEFEQQHGIDLSRDNQAMQRLREVAEQTKIALSNYHETEITLPFITANTAGPRHLQLRLTRSAFEHMTADLLQRCVEVFERVLRDARMRADEFDRVILVGGATRMPAIQELVQRLTGESIAHDQIDPDEVVALGAAIQAGILGGEVGGIALLDVLPLSLGVETMGGVMTRLIERNTTIPIRKSSYFSTAADHQNAVDIHVLQGERELAADNISLGRFRLQGIPDAARGEPQIEITFDIDASGMLGVSARDKATGTEQSIRLVARTGMDQTAIEGMVHEARQHATEDHHYHDLVDARNQADTLIYQVEHALHTVQHRISIIDRRRIEDQIHILRQAMLADDLARIHQHFAVLQQVAAAHLPQNWAGDLMREVSGSDRNAEH